MGLQAAIKQEADLAVEAQEDRFANMAVRHVVMCVHGIGQLLAGAAIDEDAKEVRLRVNAMLDSHLPASEIGKGYIQVLPVQWRKNLDLEV